jgi:hypothetical protein
MAAFDDVHRQCAALTAPMWQHFCLDIFLQLPLTQSTMHQLYCFHLPAQPR